MNEAIPPPIPYAERQVSPRSAPLLVAAVLCFVGTLVPLAWLATQAAQFRQKAFLAGLKGIRLPMWLLSLEEAACGLLGVALLIVCGVMLCVRARWAIHVTGALMCIVIVGGMTETFTETVFRLYHGSPNNEPVYEHVGEVALRAVTGVAWPLAVAALLCSRSVQTAIIARRGSMPAMPVLPLLCGAVLVWYGLSETSLHEQAIPIGIYFNRYYSGTAVTLWRVAFAAAWVLAGVWVLRRKTTGWVLAVLVTLAAITSEIMLAAAGGSDALAKQTFTDTADQLSAVLAMGAEPNAPWTAALWRGAAPLCLLLFLAVPHILLEDDPEPGEQEMGTEPTTDNE